MCPIPLFIYSWIRVRGLTCVRRYEHDQEHVHDYCSKYVHNAALRRAGCGPGGHGNGTSWEFSNMRVMR